MDHAYWVFSTCTMLEKTGLLKDNVCTCTIQRTFIKFVIQWVSNSNGRLPATVLEHLVKLFYIYVHVQHEYHLSDTDFALLFHKAVIHEVGERLGISDEAHCPQ